jgi:hypothetical protein
MDLAIIWALIGLVVRPNSLRDPVTLYLLAGRWTCHDRRRLLLSAIRTCLAPGIAVNS